METRTAQIQLDQKDTYSVVAYLGKELPENYRNLILSKWLRSLKFGNDFFRLVDNDAYFREYQKYIKLILERPHTVVRLAVLTTEPDTCLGFSVSEQDALCFVWVHKDNRKIGIGTSLTNFDFTTITHLTTNVLALWQKKYPKVIFNPFR